MEALGWFLTFTSMAKANIDEENTKTIIMIFNYKLNTKKKQAM